MAPKRYSGARKKLKNNKNLKSKISCQTPFKCLTAFDFRLPLSLLASLPVSLLVTCCLPYADWPIPAHKPIYSTSLICASLPSCQAARLFLSFALSACSFSFCLPVYKFSFCLPLFRFSFRLLSVGFLSVCLSGDFLTNCLL
jgi:hypothetical protein